MNVTEQGFARNGETEIYYEVFDHRGVELKGTVLFVNGLGSQMINFRVDWLRKFAQAGFRCIRMDNRDVGLSSKTRGNPPIFRSALERMLCTDKPAVNSAYELTDMAQDCLVVLDETATKRAHIWGVSMGGMIAQTFAAIYPDRTETLTSVMSTTGNPLVGQPTSVALEALSRNAAGETREEITSELVHASELYSGDLFDSISARIIIEEAYDRCYCPDGMAFQMAAIASSGDRTEMLKAIIAPTFVIHGSIDPLINWDGGEATVEAIPKSTFVLYEHMGHDLPIQLWDAYLENFLDLVKVNP